MTLPPRNHPDRIEKMRENILAGRSPFYGDTGEAISRPEVPKGSTVPQYYNAGILKGCEIKDNPRLRYFGPVKGWWVIPEGAEYQWAEEKPHSRRDQEHKVCSYHGSLNEMRDAVEDTVFQDPERRIHRRRKLSSFNWRRFRKGYDPCGGM